MPAPNPFLGRGGAMGLGEETVWGTAVARTVWFALISSSLRRTIEKVPRPVLAEASASRARRSHYISKDTCAGTVELLMTYEGCGFLLKHLLHGTPATTGPVSTIYTHTYKLAGAVPTGGLTIEIVRGTGTNSDVFEGCRITKGVFKIEAGGLLRVTLDFIGETVTRGAAGTPSYTTSRDLPVLHSQAAAATWNAGSIYSKSAEFTIDNHFAERMLLGSSNSAEPAPSDFLTLECKLSGEWSADTLQTGYAADTASDLVLAFTGTGSRVMTLTLHNAYIKDNDGPVNTVGPLPEDTVFVGESDGTDEGFQVVIANTASSATAA